MKRYCVLILILTSFKCFSQKVSGVNISQNKKIVRIEICSLNPCRLVVDFHCNEERFREILSTPSPYDEKNFISDRFKGEIIGQDERVKLIAKKLEKLKRQKPLKCRDYNIYCRVLLDIYYEDGHKDVLYVDDAIRQCIYYNGVKYNRNFTLYKAITKVLPESYRRCVKKRWLPACY